MELDLTTFAGIVAATTTLVGMAKVLLPKWVKGREILLSFLIPIFLVSLVKFLGDGFVESSWSDVLIGAIGASLSAGVLHDKLTSPFMKKLKKSK